MSVKFIPTFVVLFCATIAVSASDKSVKAPQEEHTHSLSFDHGKTIKARKISLKVKNGKDCSHVAKYENGEIITEIGALSPFSGSATINLAGEQTVTMYNYAGQVCFTSVSKNWEIQDKNVVHHHDGFDVQTNKKNQLVLIR